MNRRHNTGISSNVKNEEFVFGQFIGICLLYFKFSRAFQLLNLRMSVTRVCIKFCNTKDYSIGICIQTQHYLISIARNLRVVSLDSY